MAGAPGVYVKTARKSDSVAVSNSGETEYEFRGGTVAFVMKANDLEVIRASWKALEVVSGDDYITLLPGQSYDEDFVKLGTKETPNGTAEETVTLYLHAPDASGNVEVGIISWL